MTTAKTWTSSSRPARRPSLFVGHAVASPRAVAIVAAAGVAGLGAIGLVAGILPGAFRWQIAVFPVEAAS